MSSLWRAQDETLERVVQVTLLDPAEPHTADVLDAARRITLAKDSRLAQIFDVGQDGEAAFVVAENLPGRTLTQAVSGSPLPAPEARRLVGEAAQALSRAADRGLHHQRLTPEALVIGTDGALKLTGTAVEAAATGAESRDPDVAARVDALGLVCILYAALTGRWPGTMPSDLPAAPRIGGRPVAPGDLVSGIPSDLDDLCTQTLSSGPGCPISPAEVAERLAPWSGVQPLTNPRGLLLTAPTDPRSSSTGAPAEPDRPRTGATQAATTASALSNVSPSSAAMAAAAAAVSRLQFSFPAKDDPEALPRGSFQGWSDLSTIGLPVPDEELLVPFVPPVPVEQPPRDQSRFVIAVVVAFVLFVVMVAAVSLRTLRSPTELLPDDVTRSIPAAPATASAGGAVATGSGTPTKPPPSPTRTASALATPSASPEFVAAQAIDPQGDGAENNSQASRAVDGDSGTGWKSNYYENADFAGLKKGVGLVLDLGGGEVPNVQQVLVDVAGSGGAVELRTAPGPGLDGSAVVAQAAITGGRAVLTPTRPVNSRLLVLWFTKLPRTDGKYQLLVSEITVR